MFNFLSEIVEILVHIPEYILWVIETGWNLLMDAVQGLFSLVSIIPLPSTPEPPEYIETLNWFFPVGAVITIMTPIVVGYIAFLLVRWIYKWVGQL